MDPNGSYPNKVRSSESDAYISPLHEALRGTTALPVSNDILAFESLPSDSPSMVNSSLAPNAPLEPTMMLVNDSSMMPHHENVGLAPLPPQLSDTIINPLSMVNTIVPQPNNEEIHQDEHEMFKHEDFLSNPLWNYADSYHHTYTSPMESPSFTSLLQTDPNSIVHTQLNTNGAMEDGSISDMPTMHVSEVNSLPYGFCCSPENIDPFTPNTILQQQNIQNGRLLYDASYGVPAPISPFMTTSHVPREDKTPLVGPNGIFGSGILHGSTSLGNYTCKICGRKFITSQAYGGHMSSHAKERKKQLQS
uniref:C2H2-type domain-containing protein n=2 Tax=Aegilops tauschii TaxID=37682 RepID=A0A453C3I2_AEGTS